jgi:hypothetical protein
VWKNRRHLRDERFIVEKNSGIIDKIFADISSSSTLIITLCKNLRRATASCPMLVKYKPK